MILICKSQAQTFIVSNLDQTPSQISLVNTVQYRALSTSFTTGSEETTLQSMVTRLEGFDGGNEFVSIYENVITNSVNQPGISYATFQDDPDDLGSNDEFRFTPNGDVSLSAMTTYWLVFGTSGGAGEQFNIFFTTSIAQTGSTEWSIGNSATALFHNGIWNVINDSAALQFQINAIIPESSTYIFASGICLIAFAMFRRIRISQTS